MPEPGPQDAVLRLLARYRQRLAARGVLLIALVGGCIAVLAWRAADRAPASRVIGGAAAACAVAGGLILARMRREQALGSSAVQALDRRLGLQARLLTLSEFAQSPTRPALYDALVEDVNRVVADTSRHLPPVVDRWNGAAAIALALLILWAWPRIGGPLQIAQAPTPPISLDLSQTPPEPPSSPDGSPSPQQGPSSDQSSNQHGPSQDQQSGAGGQGQQSQSGQVGQSGGQNRADGQRGNGRDASQSGQGSGQSSQQGQGNAQSSSGDQGQRAEGQQQRGDQAAGQRGQGADGSGNQGQSAGDKQAAQDAQRSGQDGAANQSGAKPSERQGSEGQPSESAGASRQDGGQRRPQPQAGQRDAAQREQSRPNGKGQPGQQAGGDTPQNAALKQDIQQLLHELSGEVRNLQAQLAQQQPSPVPGESTDPELYGAPENEPPPSGPGARLPVSLETDTKPASSKKRAATGLAQASGDVSDQQPQLEAEDAGLAPTPAEQRAAPTQRIPPEYRPVFDRLSSRSTESVHKQPTQ